MRLLVVIGAGASADCFPIHSNKLAGSETLPLANQLFAPHPTQDNFLYQYNLMGLAAKLRHKAHMEGNSFDIESELANINEQATKRTDLDNLQSLFKARFYLHSLINSLTKKTLNITSSHTVYVDLLNKLKDWIDEAPKHHFVDIVTFNYDNLLEKAMENVYSFEWYSQNIENPLQAYYSHSNLRIFKPHGSINWGRKVNYYNWTRNKNRFSYSHINTTFENFYKIELGNKFSIIDPDCFSTNTEKDFVPAMAVPFKEKTNFDE